MSPLPESYRNIIRNRLNKQILQRLQGRGIGFYFFKFRSQSLQSQGSIKVGSSTQVVKAWLLRRITRNVEEKELVVEDCEDEYIESSTAAVSRLLFQLKIQRKSCTIIASSTRAT